MNDVSLKEALDLLNEFCEFNVDDMFDLRRLPELQDRAEELLRRFRQLFPVEKDSRC